MAGLLVSAQGLVKRFGAKTAVNGLRLHVSTGEVVAVIGPNGAGKSTTLDLLLGLRRPDEGEVRYRWSEPRRRMGVQLQATPYFSGLSAIEHVRLFSSLYGARLSAAKAVELLQACGLGEAMHVEAGKLSGGQQKRLAIAIAIAHDPELIFLDEPTAALDPRARQEVRRLIRALARRGSGVVFTSHDMEEVEKTADRVVMIASGQAIAEGTPGELCQSHHVESLEKLYLKLTEPKGEAV